MSGYRYMSEGLCRVPPHPDKLREMEEQNRGPTALGSERPLGFNDGTVLPKTSYPTGVPDRVIASEASNQPKPSGDFKCIVVLAEFPDQAMKSGAKEHFNDLFFSNKKLPNGSVRDYYTEVSGGKVNIVGDVVGPFKLPHDTAFYANSDNGNTEEEPNVQTMANDVVSCIADAKISMKPYDNFGRLDGTVDAFIIVHSGIGGEESGSLETRDIWSCKFNIPEMRAVGGANIFAFLTIPESAELGVCAHEMGHLVFGWPDLYDTSHKSKGIGDWCLMSHGNWNGSTPGATPAHPSAWCKLQQGWVEERIARSMEHVFLNEVKRTPDRTQNANRSGFVYRLWANGDVNSKEYFLIESRMRFNYDAKIPGEGLLIWHIDESVQRQNDQNHFKVTLMNADAQEIGPFASGKNNGTAGNTFPGTSNNRLFNTKTMPNSMSFAHMDTFVSVSNISDPGPTMKMDVSVR